VRVLFFLLLLLIEQPAPVARAEFLFRDSGDGRVIALIVVEVDGNLLQIEAHAKDPRIQPPRGPHGVAGENFFAAGQFASAHAELVTGLQRTPFLVTLVEPYTRRVFSPEFMERATAAPRAVTIEAAAVCVERTLSGVWVGGEVRLIVDWEPGKIHAIRQP